MASTPATGMGLGIHSVGVPGLSLRLNVDKNFNQSSCVMYGSHKNAVVITVYEGDDGTASKQTDT